MQLQAGAGHSRHCDWHRSAGTAGSSQVSMQSRREGREEPVGSALAPWGLPSARAGRGGELRRQPYGPSGSTFLTLPVFLATAQLFGEMLAGLPGC